MHNNMNSADNNMVNMNKDMVGMDADKRNTLVVILGPTGVGKTELCLRVAEHFDIPIINADSRQLFREIPVGTAAPTAEQQQRVKHYFVGTLGLDAITALLCMRRM